MRKSVFAFLLVVVVNGAINLLGGPVAKMQARRMAAKMAARNPRIVGR